jgi:tryptophan 7-halogenase
LFRDHAAAYQDGIDLFRIDSWVQVLRGQRVEPRSYHRVGHAMPADQLRKTLTDLQAGIAKQLMALPSHERFLDRYAGPQAA